VELGIQGLNSISRFDATLPLARLAEELGYGSWWAQDHVVLPTAPGAPIDPTTPIVDAMVHLAHVAAATSRMTLGTAVLILPQRNPLVLAKQAASLDVLSGGRFVLGVGAGWLVAEMAAVGVPATGRGGRTDEYLDAMTALWTQPAPEFHGRHVDFAEVDAHPRPIGLRVVVGGRSAGAYRRAVSRAHAYGDSSCPGLTRRMIESIDSQFPRRFAICVGWPTFSLNHCSCRWLGRRPLRKWPPWRWSNAVWRRKGWARSVSNFIAINRTSVRLLKRLDARGNSAAQKPRISNPLFQSSSNAAGP